MDDKDLIDTVRIDPALEEGSAEAKERDRKLLWKPMGFRYVGNEVARSPEITNGIFMHLKYSDKISLSSGAIFDLRQDTHLALADTRQGFRIDRILAYCVIVWGICVLCLAACNNLRDLMIVRAILGLAESTVSPGFLIIVTAWYKREEQTVRIMLFFWVLMCCYGIGKAATGNSLQPWRAINVFLGALSLLWGFVMAWNLGTPAHVKWLTDEERELLRLRLLSNKDGEHESGVKVKWNQVWECFRDPQIYFQFVFMLLICTASGGITSFSALIVNSFGFPAAESLALQLPWYFLQTSFIIAIILIYRRYPHKNWSLLISIFAMLPAIIGIFLEGLLPKSMKWGRLIGFWITGPYVISQFLLMSTLAQNVAGRTKKSVAQALTFISYCLGFLIGPQFFWASSAPDYKPGLYTTAACFVLVEMILICWFFGRELRTKRETVLSGKRG
uniref:Major facilitator superfamily (MFS) profile domain-containing protein n=1 Tax=Kwoniella dejecticola CBS 10117 TaxID=1296121 RepID=A0A1A5ZV02_9TREE|nr:uncharacterized protein I303_08410 [Kwoniella dejecticola CBS 10117]OBR81639.1 hypothetical protein I303_08410 [Kwoniella dejecticola CBS 10117]